MATAKVIEEFDCGADAVEGMRHVLRVRFGEMYDLRAGALNWEDIEGVHGMRVASRRLRSALRDFDDILGSKGVTRRRLRGVAGALGEVRDQDVAIAALEKQRPKAGGEVAAGIGQLVNEREALRERARVRLESAVAEAPLAELQEKFLARLERVGRGGRVKGGGKRARGAARAVSFRQAGVEIIKSCLAELGDFSDSLHHPFNVEPLHRMRIAAKRLRYAMDLFAPCWGGTLSACSREVAELQAALGDLRDCDTWIVDLGARLDRHRQEAAAALAQADDSQLRQAAVWLLHHFTKERGKHFRRALTRWHKWETNGFFERLTALLDDAQTAEPEAQARPLEPAAPADGADAAGDAGEGAAAESGTAAQRRSASRAS